MLRIMALVLSLVFLTSAEFPPLARADDNKTASQVQRVISDQISAFLEDDISRAFSHAAPAIKQMFGTPERFVEMVKSGYRPLYKPSNFRFGKNKWMDGIIYQQVFATDEAEKTWEAVYSLSLFTDGKWKINGVVIQPLKGDAI